jgi:hypothetical protein
MVDISAAFHAAMDFIMAFLPLKFLWGLQMKLPEKIAVTLAMSTGMLYVLLNSLLETYGC